MKKININIPHPKKHEEDAPPLLLEKNELLCLAVFDGLGGAGSTHNLVSWSSVPTLKTKAYIASRIAQYLINEIFKRSKNISNFIEYLNDFHKHYEQQAEYQRKSPKTILKGSMLKEYPTTIAGIVTDLNKEERHIFWLGDSRVYGIYEEQIVPLSKDHSIDIDPFYRSSNAKLTQYLQASPCPKLEIRNISSLHKQYRYGKLLGIFVCTDGLYDVFENIFTFYEFILKILIEDLSQSQVENHLKSMNLNDDLSMSLVLFDNVTIDQLNVLLKKQNMKTSLNLQNENLQNEMKNKHRLMIDFFINLSYRILNDPEKKVKQFLEKNYASDSFHDKKKSIKLLDQLYQKSCSKIEYLKSLKQIPDDLSILNTYYDQLILKVPNYIQHYEEYKKTYLKHLFDV